MKNGKSWQSEWGTEERSYKDWDERETYNQEAEEHMLEETRSEKMFSLFVYDVFIDQVLAISPFKWLD